MLRSWKFRLVFVCLSGLILMGIIAPLAGLFFKTGVTDLVQTASDAQTRSSIWQSLMSSFVAALLFGLASVPLAYVLARKDFRGRDWINGLIDLPVVIPHSAAGIAILGVLGHNSLIGRAGEAAGIPFVGGTAGIVLAMAFVSVPYAINAARDGFSSVPVRLEKAALNLGASPWRVFFSISLPLAKRQVLTGLTMMWARGLSEFGAVVIIAYHPMTAPVLIWERFASFGLSYARPVAALFVIICLLIFVLMRYLSKPAQYARD